MRKKTFMIAGDQKFVKPVKKKTPTFRIVLGVARIHFRRAIERQLSFNYTLQFEMPDYSVFAI